MSTMLPDHLERLGADLDAAWSRLYGGPARRRRTTARRLRRGGAAALVAGLAVGIWTVVSGSGPGAVERAIAAIQDYPPNLIVHRVDEFIGPGGKVVRQQEYWAATSPPYEQRTLTYVYGHVVEQGASGNDISSYDPATNTVYIRTVLGGTLEGIGPPDDIVAGTTRIAGVLKLGGAHDAGELTVDGRVVHRIAVPNKSGTCTYDVDPATYLGLRWACTDGGGSMSVETWDYTERSPQADSALSLIAQHPGARVDRGPVQPCPPGRAANDTSDPPCVAFSPGG